MNEKYYVEALQIAKTTFATFTPSTINNTRPAGLLLECAIASNKIVETIEFIERELKSATECVFIAKFLFENKHSDFALKVMQLWQCINYCRCLLCVNE